MKFFENNLLKIKKLSIFFLMKIENKIFWYYKMQWNVHFSDNVKMCQDWNIMKNKMMWLSIVLIIYQINLFIFVNYEA